MGNTNRRKAHLGNPLERKVGFLEIEGSMSVPSHEQVCSDKHSDWVVYHRYLRCAKVVVQQNGRYPFISSVRRLLWKMPKLTLHPALPLVSLIPMEKPKVIAGACRGSERNRKRSQIEYAI